VPQDNDDDDDDDDDDNEAVLTIIEIDYLIMILYALSVVLHLSPAGVKSFERESH
jgi:hypothetical protein